MNNENLILNVIDSIIQSNEYSQTNFENFENYISINFNNKNNIQQIYQNKFYNHYFNLLFKFFNNLPQKIFCGICKYDINSNLNVCLNNHINEYGEQIVPLFENLIYNLNIIYDKEILMNLKLNLTKKTPLFDKIISNFNLEITQLIKIYCKYYLQLFKQNFKIESRCLVKNEIKETMMKIDIYKLYRDIITKFMKNEICSKITETSRIYDQKILEEIIK